MVSELPLFETELTAPEDVERKERGRRERLERLAAMPLPSARREEPRSMPATAVRPAVVLEPPGPESGPPADQEWSFDGASFV